MKKIPTNSFILNYIPVDYTDTFSKVVTCKQAITPQELRFIIFKKIPKWINWLMGFRNNLVRPFGLNTTDKFIDMIHYENYNEVIFGMSDKHLNFYVSMLCGEHKYNKQELYIITIVKYNNLLGKVYFSIIKPFHKIIVSSLLKNIETPKYT